MRIKSIRLHPFAGQTDRTFLFSDSLNLVHGANEFGKSTLFNAISAVLLIPHNPRKNAEENQLIQKCYPKTGGNELRVTLSFELDGVACELHKTWSKTAAQSIVTLKHGTSQYTGEPALLKLGEFLRLNRASWEHMLFIEQSSIHHTIEQLGKKLNSMDKIQAFMKGEDPFDRDGFIAKVRKKYEDLTSRWDKVLQRPEAGRGIENPWRQKVGAVLEAWYEKEQCKSRHQQILQDETRIGELDLSIHNMLTEKDHLDNLIRDGEPLLKDANRSLEINTEKSKIEAEGKQWTTIHPQWVSAEATLPVKREELSRLNDEVSVLQQEWANAQKRASANDMISRNTEVQKLVERLSEQKEQLSRMTDIPAAVISEVGVSEKAIQNARLQLEAQQLKATLTSDMEVNVFTTIAGQSSQEIIVRPGTDETISSPGSFSLTHGALHLRVVSGNVDVDELERTISQHEQSIRDSCAEYGASDIADLRKKQTDLIGLRDMIKVTERDIKSQLGGKDLSQWNQEVNALAQIPATRDSGVIQGDLTAKNQRVATLGMEIKGLTDRITQWQKEHDSPAALMEKVIDMRSRWKKLGEDLAALRPLPGKYQHPSEFIEALQRYQSQREMLQSNLGRLKEERSNLQGRLEKEEFSAEELLEKMQFAESMHRQKLMEAEALDRIISVHETIRQEKQKDPFDRVGERITALLERLSGGRYSTAKFDNNLPQTIGNDDITLEADLLSKGMKGSLALAVRLAYAEVYLADMDGFLMLDDPFTELDPDRRRFAAEVLRDVAGSKQVILYTCHPEHARVLEEMSAVPVRIS